MSKIKFVVLIAIISVVVSVGCVNAPTKETVVPSTPTATSTADVIIEGQGWKSVVLGATRNSIDKELGTPNKTEEFDDVYFGDYESQGIQVNYDKSTNIAKAIFFYHGQEDSPRFNYFNKKTDRNIGFENTAEEVINIYGKPLNDFKKANWRRIEYRGIDFRFENGKMVRISVFK